MPSLTIKIIAKVLFRARGWTFEPLPDYWQPKQVLIGFPHTEWLDTAMAFGGFALSNQKGHIIVKKEAFTFPFTTLLNWIGAVPVDRSLKKGLVEQMVDQFDKHDVFQLAIVPDGSRVAASKIKTGFWHIARGAGVPIVYWYFDHANKCTRFLGQMTPSDDLQADLAKIKRAYADAGYDIVGIRVPVDGEQPIP